ncbi:hypothetical protein IJG29_00920 [Candidatus Saccharibacteria bacterium]|nr:hypothetical protein [Candidatus Saccharibacteria bacterium]
MTRGARNLIILGVVSAAIALTTTGVSLAVYHNSGDIYLDRSRPGYLPDQEEIEEDLEDNDYDFDEDGKVTKETLEEYLNEFAEEVDAVDAFKAPFAADQLSDEKLGIK